MLYNFGLSLVWFTKHTVWTHRNQIVHEGIAFNSDYIIRKKMTSMIKQKEYNADS